MIKINGKQYDNYSIKITWVDFERTDFGEKIKSISPFIEFIVEDVIFIGLATCLPKKVLENMNFNEKINIKSYLSDITYEDEKGWISIITGDYTCNLTRINDKNFKIKFDINSEEIENYNIIIDTNLELA